MTKCDKMAMDDIRYIYTYDDTDSEAKSSNTSWLPSIDFSFDTSFVHVYVQVNKTLSAPVDKIHVLALCARFVTLALCAKFGAIPTIIYKVTAFWKKWHT